MTTSEAERSTAAIPSSTYRLQLNRGFSFDDLAELIPYLDELGVATLYVSPILAARCGSSHGYDIIDHETLNPEIGTEQAHERLVRAAREARMGILVDMVPNHMCIADDGNWRWHDVLENGPSSPQAPFFDVDWQPPREDVANKVLLPVLGDQYGVVLENGELLIEYNDGGFYARYWEKKYPMAPRSWPLLLELVLTDLRERLGETDTAVLELESIITAIGYLPLRSETDPARIRERQREKSVIRSRLSRLTQECPGCQEAIEQAIKQVNGVPGDPRSFDLLETVLSEQGYRLAFWRVAADEINYRRFFDINELAAIRVEDPEVFAAVHRRVLEGIRDGWVTGLRIDHPDGLYDPVQYFHDLQAACSEALQQGSTQDRAPGPHFKPFYIVAEKIMSGDERPRGTWAVHGTTGYGFLDELNGIFVDVNAERPMVEAYERFTGNRSSFADLVYACKRLILRVSMSSELNVLSRRLDRICQQHRHTRDFTLDSLRFALREIISCFPVYRTYIREGQDEVDPEDRRHVEYAIAEASRRNPAVSASVFETIGNILMLEPQYGISPEQAAERRLFIMRFQQLTGPVMAKGVEDTAFYRWYPLASLNEVGGDPAVFGLTLDDFHHRVLDRYRFWPHGLLATSTHDTKRSEDVRARLNVLSEIPTEWAEAVERWRMLNRQHKTILKGVEWPDRNAEYLLYQTIVGAWPLPGSQDAENYSAFVGRIQAYMEKALREAKVHTSWINPNPSYDEALRLFVASVLEEREDNAFLADLRKFIDSVMFAGLLNSVSQVVLKLTCPGVPDIYQGNEIPDFSLVDPDNRRPVDYARRRRMMESLRGWREEDREQQIRSLLSEPYDGRLKLLATQCLLRFRRDNEEFFRDSAYVPLGTFGDERHVITFARTTGDRVLVIAAARFFIRLGCRTRPPIGDDVWQDAAIVLPGDTPGLRFRDVLSGRVIRPAMYRRRSLLPLSEVFANLPVAVLESVVSDR